MELIYLNNDKYYVYEHYIIDNKGNKNVFYIGKGKGDRIYDQNRNVLWENIVNENNSKYNADIIKFFNNEYDAFLYEKELQEYYFNKGQCKGCADIHKVINRFKKENFYIDEEVIDIWMNKNEIENIIKKFNIRNIILEGNSRGCSKGGIMSVNKFRKYINNFGYKIEKARKTINGNKSTYYKIIEL